MKKTIYILILIFASNSIAQNNDDVKSILSFSVRGITPIGIFSDNWNTGGAVYISYSWLYYKKWSVRLQTGYNRYRLKSESDYSNSPKLSMLPIQIGGRRIFLDGKFKFFVEAMSGINFIRIFYKEEDTQVDERETHLNFQTGGGISYRLSDKFEIELAVLYNSHLITPSIPYNLTGFEYGIGLNWIL